MSGILIKTVRIKGFRGLKNIEVELEQTTVLTGMNNAGKTSFLKALQVVFGNRQFITQDDFFIENGSSVDKIIIDILIVPLNGDDFSEENGEEHNTWEDIFTIRIRADEDKAFVPLRTIVESDSIKIEQYILEGWSSFDNWYEQPNGVKKSFRFEELPFFYMDAQRDILDDLKSKSSYLAKMLSKINYTDEALLNIEEQIKVLNQTAVNDSSILRDIRDTLKGIDSTIGSNNENIEITPFTKKVRDLNKGLTIYYGDEQDSFPMEHHGMGTRSWSSLLTLKSFIQLLESNSDDNPFFPILAIEEPESHLHPNAQKKLYSQINEIQGQKIISTHSPYIAGASNIAEIRSFYKDRVVKCGKIDITSFDSEALRKIERQVINSRGEIFFSKCLVLFEGETEEQALPIFCERYFGKTSVELGIDFVGVGGFGNYLPFIRFAENLQIPWFIISDNDQNGEIRTNVIKQFNDSPTTKNQNDVLIFLNDECDFEKELIHDGFQDEIKKALVDIGDYHNEQHRAFKENTINAYDDDKLYEEMTIKGMKTKLAPHISYEVSISEKSLPTKVISLFNKIKTILNIDDEDI